MNKWVLCTMYTVGSGNQDMWLNVDSVAYFNKVTVDDVVYTLPTFYDETVWPPSTYIAEDVTYILGKERI